MAGLAERLRQRVAIERWAGVPDGAGGFADGGWGAGEEAWAELRDTGQRTAIEAEARTAKTRMRALLRPVAVDQACRVRWGARLFAVLGVTADPATPDRIELLLEDT